MPTNQTTGLVTSATSGGFLQRWRDAFETVLSAIAAGSAQNQSFQGAYPGPKQFLVTFGSPTQAVIEAIAAYNRIVESNRDGLPSLPQFGFGANLLNASAVTTPNGVSVAELPSLQNQTDALDLSPSKNMTLADQIAGARPFVGVPKPLRRQLRRMRRGR